MHFTNGTLSLSPSDLTAYLACHHLVSLELEAARGERERPPDLPDSDLVRRKGEEHEQAYLERLRGEGLDVHEVSWQFPDWRAGAAATEEAMRAGPEVIYQAVLQNERWRGVADFLIRIEAPSALGGWSYQVLDTKLARGAKPSHILQLCFYDEQVARLQQLQPAAIHVLLGNGERSSFDPRDFGAYYRRLRDRFVAFTASPPPTEPYPNSHCGICDFKPVCDEWWEGVDHLSRVAGFRRGYVEPLAAAGVRTLAQLARADAQIAGINDQALERLREQAALQLDARETGKDAYVLLPAEAGRGLALLPPPSPGDVFFDIEGDPFFAADGSLEYLWGALDSDGYHAFWAHNRVTERVAFETLVDHITTRLELHPDMHVYHYASYELSALRRLMGRYGSREDEVDNFLRRGVLVDLYAVVRNGVRVSQPRYSIKNLEVFLPMTREAELKDGGTSIVMFEDWVQTRDESILHEIEHYNREDCEATLLLRDWLLERKDELGPIPVASAPNPIPILSDKDTARAHLKDELVAAGEALAGELLDYHRREAKPVYWQFFDRRDRAPDELVEDGDSIGLLEPVGEPEQVKQSLVHELAYPPQEHKLRARQAPYDPEQRRNAGTIVFVDRERSRVWLRRGIRHYKDVPLPRALIPGGPYDTDDQRDALLRLATSIRDGDHRYRALKDVLHRAPPRAGRRERIQVAGAESIAELALALDQSYLFVQGPPGSGKTVTGAHVIKRLIEADKRVGVASPSHKAIHNLLDALERTGADYSGVKKASSGNPESRYQSLHVDWLEDAQACADAACDLLAGTTWLFSNASFDGMLDYLVIDEAGQVSLADALAMGTCAENLILLGDPLQLAHVSQGSHPAGSGASVLEHLLGEHRTIPENRGVFLERTYRLHPDVCVYISEAFYEGRLEPDPSTRDQTTPFGTGLRYLAVEHEGRRQESPEEAAVVRAEVDRLLAAGMTPEEILVVAPYNAQVNCLEEHLPPGIRVGTVDKFQGQEAPVLFYSMASSSIEEVPRGLAFLFSRNRLNVAISRARALAYLVCSPGLLEVDCQTIEQMRLANAMCRFVEVAVEP